MGEKYPQGILMNKHRTLHSQMTLRHIFQNRLFVRSTGQIELVRVMLARIIRQEITYNCKISQFFGQGILHHGNHLGISSQVFHQAADIGRIVGLKGIEDRYQYELSGGMQKRVGLARAVITKPEIIFFDEPTTGLDPIMADVINDLIVESAKGLGATTLTITHDMASVKKIADKLAMLYKGKIIWQGTVKEMEKTDNPYVQQFINGCSQGPIKVEV